MILLEIPPYMTVKLSYLGFHSSSLSDIEISSSASRTTNNSTDQANVRVSIPM